MDDVVQVSAVRNRLVRFLVVGLSLTTAVATVVAAGPEPAHAERGFPKAVATFAGTASSGLPVAAMAGDGTLVVGRDVPGDTGGLQVQVRRPGGGWGATTVLERAAAGVDPWSLQLVGGPDGAVAAVWNAGGGRGYRAALRPAGATGWTSPRAVGVRPALDGLALDDRGRLWVAGVLGVSTRVQVFGARGGPRTIRLPEPSAGQRDTRHQIVVGSNGRARLAYVRERTVTTTVGGTTECSYAGDLVVAEVAPGATPTPRRLVHRTATGGGGTGACFLDTGSSFGRLAMVAGADGSTTLLSSVVQHPSETTSVTARRAGRGRGWPSAGRTAVPATAQSFVGAAAVGSRVLALVSAAGAAPALRVATQSPSGSWSSPRLLQAGATTSVGIAGSRGGGLVAWRELDAPYSFHVRAVSARGDLGRSQTLEGASTFVAGDVVADEQGDGGVVFLPVEGRPTRFLPYDGAGPRVTRLVVPKRVRRGTVVRLRAAAVDTWSHVRSYRWRVGPAKRAGRAVQVRLRQPGRVRVVLTVTDRRGTTSTVTRTIRVRERR